MEIKRDFKNDLLGRREIIVVVEAEKNPGIEAVKEMISSELKADKELIVVKKLEGHYGKSVFDVEAFIYNSKEEKESVEPKPKKKADGATGSGEGSGEVVPAVPAAEVSKVEEKKEEVDREEQSSSVPSADDTTEGNVKTESEGGAKDGEGSGDGKVEEKKEEEKPVEGGSE